MMYMSVVDGKTYPSTENYSSQAAMERQEYLQCIFVCPLTSALLCFLLEL